MSAHAEMPDDVDDPYVRRVDDPPARKAHTPPRSVRVREALWRAAQKKAAERGETVTDVLVRALDGYVERP